MSDKGNKMIVYSDEEGDLEISVLFSDEDVWVTQVQLADLYGTTRQNI
jgi:hypothetical protein